MKAASFEQRFESSLLEVVVSGECLRYPVFLHDDERDAVRQRPVLIWTILVQSPTGIERRERVRLDLDVRRARGRLDLDVWRIPQVVDEFSAFLTINGIAKRIRGFRQNPTVVTSLHLSALAASMARPCAASRGLNKARK